MDYASMTIGELNAMQSATALSLCRIDATYPASTPEVRHQIRVMRLDRLAKITDEISRRQIAA